MRGRAWTWVSGVAVRVRTARLVVRGDECFITALAFCDGAGCRSCGSCLIEERTSRRKM